MLCSSPVDVVSVVEQLQTISAVKDKNVPLFDKDVFENVRIMAKVEQILVSVWSQCIKISTKVLECKRAEEIFQDFLSRIDTAAMDNMDLMVHCGNQNGLIKKPGIAENKS